MVMYDEVEGYQKNESWKKIATHDENNIMGFFGENRFLSNFEPCVVEINGTVFRSSESAYQSMKFVHIQGLFLQFRGITAYQSKKLANANKANIIGGWDNMKIHIMTSVVRQKFSNKNPLLLQKLLDTGDKYLEETNYWNDSFWGVFKGKGENRLGEIIMEVRRLRGL